MAKAEVMVAALCRARAFARSISTARWLRRRSGAACRSATIAERAARAVRGRRSRLAERAAEPPVYVIGTEVPVPGGATEDLDELAVTTPQAALRDDRHAPRAVRASAGWPSAWPRVIATVVQPGVEFDHHKVIDYAPEKARALSTFIEPVDAVRLRGAFDRLPDAPAACRAGARSLRDPEGRARRYLCAARGACGRSTRSSARCSSADRAPGFARSRSSDARRAAHWRKYYHAQPARTRLELQYSLSDRIRYYWPDPQIAAAQRQAVRQPARDPPPLALVSQYLPIAYAACRAGRSATRSAPTRRSRMSARARMPITERASPDV